MSEEQKEAGRIVDLGTFAPVATIPFRYKTHNLKAFSILDVPRRTRNAVLAFNDRLRACSSIDEQIEVAIEIIDGFVPGAPLDELRDEPLALLMRAVIGLANGGSEGDPRSEARPTKARRRSSSGTRTRG